MAFTFKQLKQAKNNLVAAGLDPAAAAGVLSSAAPATIEKIMAGDIPQAIKDQGANDPQVTASATQNTKDQEPRKDQQKDQKKNLVSRKAPAGVCAKDRMKRSSAPQAPAFDTPANVPQATALDCPQECAHDPAMAPDDPHALPAGLYDDICASIDYYCDTHDIKDKQKIHPLQWQGICYRIGETIKARKLLHDFPREKSHGGTVYDGEKITALLNLYGVICADYKQVAFTFNFARFAGVSTDYLHDYMQRGLTSARVGLREKALELQKASLVGAVTGGGSATVGNIFLSKALAGLQETTTVVHVSASPSVNLSELPKLDQITG